ncbi:cytokine-dependent hematopoietic cell linker isoform X2 [Echeneis naucrates]|uniref:SH2 domain-containing protein n=1 Tax=Echeneis naucrates TaxID=173247 RepID=A0A665WMW1_ECHNA|nr:cytokine-dependent hematopoietic cell linker isoform X2 [Echeneis naucrates]
MDRNRTDRNRNQRCGNNSKYMEPEYDVVDDQEEMLKVCILPARPINEEREYADRNLPRSSAQSVSSPSTGNSIIVPRRPHRELPQIIGPAVNRDLKPGRRKTPLDLRPLPVLPGIQRSHRCSPPPLPSTLELVNHLSGLTLDKSSGSDGQQKAARKAEFSPFVAGQKRAESVPVLHLNVKHSLDLETQIEIRSHQNLERVPSKHHHHEWPQTKEDFDQHEFVPREKPQQTYREEDWYIGPCNRADAEHALHLVNKDGAFLVRDCSNNTKSEPLVLAVYHEKKVYNVKIRFIESASKYALGTGQRSKDMFDSVADIVKFHTIFPIILISGRNISGSKYPENCVLTCAVTRRDVDQLLE